MRGYHPCGRCGDRVRALYTGLVIVRRLCLPLLLFAFLIALVPCAPASARGGCGMRRGCPMRAMHGTCKTENSTAFDCCTMRGDRTSAPGLQAPLAPAGFAPLDGTPRPAVPAGVSARLGNDSAHVCNGVERFTLFGVFLI